MNEPLAPTRIEGFARCHKCRFLRLCEHVAGVPLCRFCRAHAEPEGAQP